MGWLESGYEGTKISFQVFIYFFCLGSIYKTNIFSSLFFHQSALYDPQ